MSKAEELAAAYDKGDEAPISGGSGKQRTKQEQVRERMIDESHRTLLQADHKHSHPEGDTRKIVANAIAGEEKRKAAELKGGAQTRVGAAKKEEEEAKKQ